ncbi:general secretion pathway protein A [Desulfocicer vacuolatum DSM 3385]|uniref:General secretion pathway protein A n=1 Tax=Desulfocicer vacuolatum DSM 3385 TaxID=1121400 RepID=A0A1W1ZNA5_9BACT|nr:general secretion pathway protein A [Desulfocicer vacuolatum DSM 3385]
MWLGETHKEALATFKYGIYENKSFLLLTGDVGCGKTTLINSFVNRLNDTVMFGVLSDPGLCLLDLFNHIAFLFGLDHTFKSKGEFLIQFTRFLNEAYVAKKRVLLIIDEAQRLSMDVLEEICMLSNIERQNAKLINIFFVGQDEFRLIVAQHPNRSLKQKLTFSCRISALDENDLEQYIQHRLKIAGTTASLFDAEAFSMIYRYSGGNPRLINILCDLALLTGFVQDKRIIDEHIVLECVKELQLSPFSTKEDTTSDEPLEQSCEALKQTEKDESVFSSDDEPLPSQETVDDTLLQEGSIIVEGAKKSWFKGLLIFVGIFLLLMCVLSFFYFPGKISKFTLFSGNGNDMLHFLTKIDNKENEHALENIENKIEKDSSEITPEIFSIPSNTSPSEEETSSPSVLEKGSISQKDNSSTLFDTPFVDIAPVDTSQNEIQEIVNFPQKKVIHFKYNSNDLSDAQRNEISQFVDILCHDQSQKIKITGHSDSIGSPSYNLQLSKFRANMVKIYMIGKGVKPEQIIVEAKGANENFVKDDTPEGRWKNRRVEMFFLDGLN